MYPTNQVGYKIVIYSTVAMGFIVENNHSPLGCALGLGIVFNDKFLARQQNLHGSVTGCGGQHPVTDPYTLRYRPEKVHVAYRLYIWICAALIQYRYCTDLLYGSITVSYILYTDCIYMSVQ